MKRLGLPIFLTFTLLAETDPRLTVHTLVREDIFAGFMANDMARFEKGMETLRQLDRERPSQRQHVRAWQGAAEIFRAALAYDAGNAAEGDRRYASAQALYDEAVSLGPDDAGVRAVVGASSALFADRLPAEKRAAAWNKAYGFYQQMAAQQMPVVDQLPVHLKGELLAGLTMTAQRTGRQEEYSKSLDKLIELMANTPYERTARAWKARPELAGKTTVMCKNCHEPGQLEARKTALAKAAE